MKPTRADSSARSHLRLTSAPDEPPPPTLEVGDFVVYASHGIGCVEATRAAPGDLTDTVVLVFENGLRVTFPVARARGALRALACDDELEAVRQTLQADPSPRMEPWTRHFRSLREKVTSGGVIGLAEVVRNGLHRERHLAVGSGGRVVAATGERSLYLQARKLLGAEIAHVREIAAAEADLWIVEQIDQHSSAGESPKAL